MSLLSHSKLAQIEERCNVVLENECVKFVGVINNLGNLIAGRFGDGMQPVGTPEIRKMMFMQLKLDLNMRKDYDGLFGPVDFVISKRKNAEKISIPIDDYMVLLITELDFNREEITNIKNEFEKLILERK